MKLYQLLLLLLREACGWAGEQWVREEAEGASCRDISGDFLHSLNHQEWLFLY